MYANVTHPRHLNRLSLLTDEHVSEDALKRFHKTGLVAPGATLDSLVANLVKIYYTNDHVDAIDGKLRCLRKHTTAARDHAGAVEIETVAVASFEISVHVHAVVARRRSRNQLQAVVKLAQLVVAGRAVGDDVDAVEAELCVQVLGNPELFAYLARQLGVAALDDADADLGRGLGCLIFEVARVLDWQVEVKQAPAEAPALEPAVLAIIIAVSQVHLRPDQQDDTVKHPDSCVIQRILKRDGHAKLAEHTVRQLVLMIYYLSEHLP